MSESEFRIGDFVEIVCQDGATFAGWLGDIQPGFVMLDSPMGRKGFHSAHVVAMTHA